MSKEPKTLDEALENIDMSWLRPLIIWGGLGAVLFAAASTSFYTVQPEEQAVVKRFGKVIDIREPGFHFKIPLGVDTTQIVPTSRVLKEEFGFRTSGVGGAGSSQYQKSRGHLGESLMLTGDLKVIDVEWVVQYRINDPDKFLHRSRQPVETLRATSEAVMRRIVGNNLGSDVLTEKRVQVATQAKLELQEILDALDVGIRINTIELQDVTPPEMVKPAFNEVNQAEQERERLINEAEKRRNQVIPRAQGQALQIISEAEGYAAERVNRANGETDRFLAILEQYSLSPEVTRKRMYLETMDKVLPQLGRVYVVEDGQVPPIPFLNMGSDSALSPTQSQNKSR